MNLEGIRSFVRTQLDLDETDLPNPLLDVYIQDGYDHIIDLENRWPFFATMWSWTIPASGQFPLPAEVGTVESLLTANGNRIWRVDNRYAEDNFGGTLQPGNSAYWSQLGSTLAVFPPPSADLSVRARGYRKPSNWISLGASGVVDADERLHVPICWYACSLGYAQQEDEVLEATYLNRFREAASIAKDSVMRHWPGQPKILNGTPHRSTPWGGQPALVFELPSGEPVFDDTIDGGSP